MDKTIHDLLDVTWPFEDNTLDDISERLIETNTLQAKDVADALKILSDMYRMLYLIFLKINEGEKIYEV